MSNRYKFGLVAVLGVLTLVGVLGAPVGVLLGLLVLVFASIIAVLANRAISVPPCTALIVCSRLNGAVTRVVKGPAATILIPLVEVEGAVMDIGLTREQVRIENVLLHDQKPTALSFTVNVMYQLSPHRLCPEQLGELLRVLTDAPNGLVRVWTDYFLRALVVKARPASIHDSGRRRMERCLQGLLSSQLNRLGVEIREVQLIVSAPNGLQQALREAEQQRAIARVQAGSLAHLLVALSGKTEEARSLADLEFAKSLGLNNQVLVALDRRVGANGARIALARPAATVRE